MKVTFLGGGFLADTLERAAQKRGFETGDGGDLVIVALGVDDHEDLSAVSVALATAIAHYPASVPIVVTSQIPPGWTRKWGRANLFYQPHTLVKGQEPEMAYEPDILVVGAVDPREPLPGAYVKYLSAFEAPIHRVSYEAAELSKLALNYYLAAQIEAVNILSKVGGSLGVDWHDDIIPALRADYRIGKYAYLYPGVVGGHLPRDIKTIERLRAQ